MIVGATQGLYLSRPAEEPDLLRRCHPWPDGDV